MKTPEGMDDAEVQVKLSLCLTNYHNMKTYSLSN
jgi:hypothetical protein